MNLCTIIINKLQPPAQAPISIIGEVAGVAILSNEERIWGRGW